jgi:ankyrin repeat protein
LPHHERIEDPVFRYAVDLIDAGDATGLRAFLKQHPKLARQHVVFEGGNYFRNPSLLEFIAENPIRHGRLPENIVATTEVILESGAEPAALVETLGLVATGRVVRECGVQIPLIDLLCDHGTDPDGALQAAIGHGEFEAAEALIGRGAAVNLPVAAALGRVEEVRGLIPAADTEDRHRALAVAAQFGHVAIVRSLLDAGEDPNRYNSGGFHSHSTPLHQAALAGHEEVVRLLIDRGANVTMRDILWKGTPADWAHHEGRTELEAYLRALEADAAKRD